MKSALLIFGLPSVLLPSIFPSIIVFSKEEFLRQTFKNVLFTHTSTGVPRAFVSSFLALLQPWQGAEMCAGEKSLLFPFIEESRK